MRKAFVCIEKRWERIVWCVLFGIHQIVFSQVLLFPLFCLCCKQCDLRSLSCNFVPFCLTNLCCLHGLQGNCSQKCSQWLFWLQIIYPWKITGEFTGAYYNIKYRKFQVCGKLIEWSRYLTMSGNTCFFLSVLLPYFVNRLCKDGSWMLVWVIVYILFVYVIVSDLLPQSMLLNPLNFGR